MTLTAQLQAKRDELAEVKAAVEAGDMEKAAQLSEAIEDVKSVENAIAEADKADKLLKSLGSVAEKPVEEKPARTLGEFAAKHLDLSAMKSGMARSAGTGFGFKAYTDPHTAPTIPTVSEYVADFKFDNGIRSLFGTESISGNALTYFVMGAKEDNSAPSPGEVAQNGAKPQFHIPYTAVTVPLQKIAGWFYDTDELLSDAPYLVSAINNRGMMELAKAVDTYLATELAGTSGIGSETYTNGSPMDADTIFAAMMDVKSNTGFDADAIIINPTDYAALRLDKDGAGQYYGGGYFFAPYANGQLNTQPGVWGLQTIISTAVPAGTALVGAFKAGATVVSKAGEGAGLEVHRGDHDDAIHNRVTVVVEERIALAVRMPGAFVLVEEAGA